MNQRIDTIFQTTTINNRFQMSFSTYPVTYRFYFPTRLLLSYLFIYISSRLFIDGYARRRVFSKPSPKHGMQAMVGENNWLTCLSIFCPNQSIFCLHSTSIVHSDHSIRISRLSAQVDQLQYTSPRPKSPSMNNEEPIELSHYPDAKKPKPYEVPRIERDDFPAPPVIAQYLNPKRRAFHSFKNSNVFL